MAVAASLLRSEMRRHLLMNIGLVASCVTAGTVVTNERGLFIPLGIHSMSETAKAFAAMFTPSHLLPGFVNVQMVVPLEPFDVTADSRDLRRRLMEVADTTGGIGDDAASQATQLAEGYTPMGPTLTATELRDNNPNAGVGQSATDGGTPAAPAGDSAPAAASTPTGNTGTGGTTNQSTGNTASTGTLNNTGLGNQGSTLVADSTQNSTANEGGGDGTTNTTTPIDPVGGGTVNPGGPAVPEPSVWVMMMAGFGTVGYALRAARRRRAAREEDAELEAA